MVDYDYNQIGQRIRQRREDLKLTQEELAERSELNQRDISVYESKGRQMYLGTLAKIARALGVSVAWLLGETTSSELSEVENELVVEFRQLTPSDQEAVLVMVRALVRHRLATK